MKCIVYISRESRRLRRADILDILRVSRMKNTVRQITGVLMYFDGLFLQVLEGEDDRIDELLHVLRHDRRHGDIRILIEEAVPERHFPNWTMALMDLASLPADERWLCRHLDRPLPELKSEALADRIRGLIGRFQAMVAEAGASGSA